MGGALRITPQAQVLHGLWPDFGQIYESAGNPAPFVGFPQWCNGWAIMFTSPCAFSSADLQRRGTQLAPCNQWHCALPLLCDG